MKHFPVLTLKIGKTLWTRNIILSLTIALGILLIRRQIDLSSTPNGFFAKYNSDGFLSRFKAIFVARGFSQQEGIDFTETFSPVIRMTSL
jgi:hypothetical protein